jgi:CheY-like chemotaxis protein
LNKMKKIILIDDKPEMQANLRTALEPLLNGKYEIEAWSTQDALDRYKANENSDNEESNADEDVWFRFFSKEENVAIVVADHDLSGYKSVRISESAIADACRQAVTPICTYHRAPSAKSASQSLRGIYGQTKSFTITLDMSPANEALAAPNIISLADGFEFIREKFSTVPEDLKQQGPAAILAYILDRPGLTNAFTLYASGPSLASDAIYHISQSKEERKAVTEDLDVRLPFILACWLNNYILPFPGLILNTKAAASYLNIETQNFKDNSDAFKKAQYIGPFSGSEKYWWRTDLEQILIDSDSEDGKEHLEKISIQVSPSVCVSTGTSPAGYYCIVRKEPISLDASVGNLGWIPHGAHLSRIDQNIYDTVAHMMGI